MDNDEAHVAGDFFLQPLSPNSNRRQTFYEHFQRFIPRETIIYIQYCLLRVPFILLYDYLLTEQFSTLINSLFKDSTEIISYILHNYFFEVLLQLNLSLSIPFLGFILLTFFLLCSDRCLVIFYSYTISLLVIYFDYHMTSVIDNQSSSINLYLLQFLLSSIYIQMLNIRPRVPSYKLQTRLCHFAPFALIITRYLLPSTLNIPVLRSYYLLWTIVHLTEIFFFHRQTIIDYVQNGFFQELYQCYQNLGLQGLFSYLQLRICIFTLLKIFWLTKIIVLPLGLRTPYTNPYITNATSNVHLIINSSQIHLPDYQSMHYNTTGLKTMYFTGLFYGTETILT